jgi:hypothetical protein
VVRHLAEALDVQPADLMGTPPRGLMPSLRLLIARLPSLSVLERDVERSVCSAAVEADHELVGQVLDGRKHVAEEASQSLRCQTTACSCPVLMVETPTIRPRSLMPVA